MRKKLQEQRISGNNPIPTEGVKFYPPEEERINISSHAIGLILSLFGLVLLIQKAIFYDNLYALASFSIFGFSLITLYASSTSYHRSRTAELRVKLRKLDHAAIFILIAGTYTPIALVTLNGPLGWSIFALTWGIAAIGVILKMRFAGRFKLLSTLMYILMGWLIMFFIKPLTENFLANGLKWLITGGVAYSIGAVAYSFQKLRFNHAIFHLFVLAGSISHFIAIYCYVMPIGLKN